MKYLSIASRLILGTVFIFSGFVKSVDPLGSAYKFSDYFAAFKLSFLSFLALPLGLILSAFELVLGITLLLGYRRRITYRVLFWFMGFFTLLTLILALFNPVSDCGCFGDALILTNWETFLKNIVLMVFVVPLFMIRDRDAHDHIHPVREWGIVGALFLVVIGFSLWNHAHLPVVDFRPYDVGTLIQEEMEIPEGAAVDDYETELIYREKASGKSERFTLENYPRDTTLWEFVDSESRLISKGYDPPIHDFAIIDAGGGDMADQILSDDGFSLVMISHDLTKANEAALLKARDWAQLEMLAGEYAFYPVTATPESEIGNIAMTLDLGYTFYSADEIMLKTVVRSNPGFLLIRNGVIVGKWSFRDFPAIEDIDPDWTELMGNAAVPVDEETLMLMEAGVYEDFSFDVIDFDPSITSFLMEQSQDRKEGRMIVIVGLCIALMLLISARISPIRA